MATDNMEKIRDFLSRQVFDDDKLYDFDQLSDDEQWNWWNKNKKFYSKEPGFSEVGMLERSKDWKKELSQYPTYMLSDDVLSEIAQVNEDVTVDELKKYRDENKKEAEYQEGRKRREKEIKEAGFFSPWTLASDYSKKRYIDEPDASIFGKEGSFNPYSTEGQRELGDVIFGATGAVADVLPGGSGVLVGPAVRSARDISHTTSDSPYQKEWGDIGSDFATDLLFNVGTNYAPTAALRYGEKRATAIGKERSKLGESLSNIGERKAVDEEMAAIQAGLGKFENIGIPTQSEVSEMKLMEAIEAATTRRTNERLARNAEQGLSLDVNKNRLEELLKNAGGELSKDVEYSKVLSENLSDLGFTVDDVMNYAKEFNNGNIEDAVLDLMHNNITALKPISEVQSDLVKAIGNELGNQKSATRWVKSLPDSPFKSDMESFVSSKNWNKDEMSKKIMDWQRALGDDFSVYANAYTTRIARELPEDIFAVAKRKVDAPTLGPWEQKGLWVAKNWEDIGTPVVKELATGDIGPFGRKPTKPKETESAKLERWRKGFATPDEMKSEEYQKFKIEQLGMTELGF